jgi:hypothetical protein
MREISTHAQAAKLIRKELKAAFPTVKFAVTSESYSMGNSVWVRWEDELERTLVETITSKYQKGHFDMMTDCYEYSNKNKNIPQVMFVQLQRTRAA